MPSDAAPCRIEKSLFKDLGKVLAVFRQFFGKGRGTYIILRKVINELC